MNAPQSYLFATQSTTGAPIKAIDSLIVVISSPVSVAAQTTQVGFDIVAI
jgi:hypothetical protein